MSANPTCTALRGCLTPALASVSRMQRWWPGFCKFSLPHEWNDTFHMLPICVAQCRDASMKNIWRKFKTYFMTFFWKSANLSNVYIMLQRKCIPITETLTVIPLKHDQRSLKCARIKSVFWKFVERKVLKFCFWCKWLFGHKNIPLLLYFMFMPDRTYLWYELNLFAQICFLL